jgi:type I site-specific restriction endonuclease
VQDTLEEKLGAIGSEIRNVEVQWNNIKECVLDTVSVLVWKVKKRARKPWTTQEMISKVSERRKWKNVNTEASRKNYRRLRNALKTVTNNAKKDYLENICKEIMEYQRTGGYDLMQI